MAVTDRGITCIAEQMPRLRRLWLSGARITDEGVQRLAAMRSLEDIRFDDPLRGTTDSGLPALLDLPQLESLYVPKHWNIDDAMMAEAARRGIDLDQF